MKSKHVKKMKFRQKELWISVPNGEQERVTYSVEVITKPPKCMDDRSIEELINCGDEDGQKFTSYMFGNTLMRPFSNQHLGPFSNKRGAE